MIIDSKNRENPNAPVQYSSECCVEHHPLIEYHLQEK